MAPSGFDGSIKIDTRIDTRGFNAGIRSMIGALRGLAAAVGLAFGIGAVVMFGRTAVDAATQLSNAMMGLQSVLEGQGRSWSAAQEFIDEYVSDGLIPATNALKSYQNLALRGYDDEQIRTTLIALKDAAAFGRRASLSMGEAVETATEGLKNENSILVDNAGVTKNVAKMWQEYAAQIGTTAARLTQQQKIQAEVNGILEESRYQVGDAAKIAGSFSGQLAALSTSFYNLRVAVGNALQPILMQIIPIIKRVIDWFVVLFNTAARVLSLFFNVNTSLGGMEGAASALADDTEAAAGAAGDLAKNTEKAGRAAKGALAAFDQINVLAQDTGSGSGAGAGAGGGAALGDVVGEPKDIIPDELMGRVEEFKQQLLEFFAPLEGPFERFREAIEGLGGTIWDGLKWAYEFILKPVGTWLAQEVAPAFLDLLTGALDLLNEILIVLQPVGEWFYDEFLVPIGNWAGQAIIDTLGFLTDRLRDLGDWVRENPEDFRTMTGVLLAFFAAWKVSQLLSSLNGLVLKLGEFALELWLNTGAWIANTTAKLANKAETVAIAALLAGDFIRKMALSVGQLIKDTAAWIANTVAKIAANAAQLALNIATGIWNGLAAVATAVTTAFGAAVAFLTSPIGLVVLAIVALIAIIVLLVKNWDWVKETAGKVWDWIKQKWAEAGDWFKQHVTEPVKEAFETALDWIEEKWKLVFSAVRDFVKGEINKIIDFINQMISAIAGGLNTVIGGLNGISVKVPSWVPVYGGKSFGFNIPLVSAPQIPRLATGAVIPGGAPFMAILGDQPAGKTNIEAPADLIRQIVREELGNIGDVVADITLELDGETIYRSQRRIERRRGRSLISGGAAA